MRVAALQRAMTRYHAGRMSRRDVLGLAGKLGLTAAAVALLGATKASAASPKGHSGHNARLQEGSPEGGPPPVATPQLGEQPDGTRIWKVLAGAMIMEELAEINAFLPGEITINAGDSIFFEMMGFHAVSFLSGGEVQPVFIPAEGAAPVATPPASAAAYPQLMFNPAVLFPAGGPAYDGTGYVNSGVALDPSTPPFVLKFTTPGTYEYLCPIHPNYMRARVIVQEAGADLPMDQAGVDQVAAEQLAAYMSTVQELKTQYGAATPAAADGATTHEVAVGPGQESVELLAFLPAELSIKAGDTVRWSYRGSISPHTVTFLGGAEQPEDIIIAPPAGGPPQVFVSPITFFPSDKPATYNGQGFVNSGYMGVLPEFLGIQYDSPDTFELTFDTPGEYKYYCIIHAGGPDDPVGQSMVGRISVS